MTQSVSRSFLWPDETDLVQRDAVAQPEMRGVGRETGSCWLRRGSDRKGQLSSPDLIELKKGKDSCELAPPEIRLDSGVILGRDVR